MLQATLNVAKIEILRISPVPGVHTGPGIVGVAVGAHGIDWMILRENHHLECKRVAGSDW